MLHLVQSRFKVSFRVFYANLSSLASRREDLSYKFFCHIADPASCLHSLHYFDCCSTFVQCLLVCVCVIVCVLVCFSLCYYCFFSDCRIYLFSSLAARVFNKLTRYLTLSLPFECDVIYERPTHFALPRLPTKFTERAFSHAGPAAWIALPLKIHAPS